MKKLFALAILAIVTTSAHARSKNILDSETMRNCGGTISVSVTDNGQRDGEQINISVKGSQRCSKLVVEDSAGRIVTWGKKKSSELDLNPNNKSKAPYGGSGTIPKDNLYLGMNSFYVVVTSTTGKTQDRFLVSDFFAWPNAAGGTTVIPSFPAPSSGSSGSGGGI